jgi:hypothetical protein
MGNPRNNCIGWWKFNNNTNAEIGQNGTWTGTPAYRTTKFSEGIDIPTHNNPATDFVTAPDNSTFTPNDFIFEFWIKPDFAVTNGAVAGIPQRSGLISWIANADYNNRVVFQCLESGNNTQLVLIVSGVVTRYIITTGFTWTAGSLNHLLIAYNRNYITGSISMKLYLNNSLIFSSTALADLFGGFAQPGEYLFGANHNSGGTPYVWNADSSIDNPKIYNNADQTLVDNILSNRNNESFPGISKLLDGGLDSPMLSGVLM